MGEMMTLITYIVQFSFEAIYHDEQQKFSFKVLSDKIVIKVYQSLFLYCLKI